jgi:hypothetical protein
MLAERMPQREITDENGVRWKVWEVRPSNAERRRQRDAYAGPERRQRDDPNRLRFKSELVSGWLAVQSGRERRRIAPIPDDWEELSEVELGRMCSAAPITGPSRRLVE